MLQVLNNAPALGKPDPGGKCLLPMGPKAGLGLAAGEVTLEEVLLGTRLHMCH